MDLRAVRLGEQSASSVSLENDGALLLRPDGFVACSRGTADTAVLDKVIASVTGR
jgi:hypothetical protein